MRTKSKFATFILSPIPGLGHIYLGFNTRGGIFMLAEMAAILLVIGLSSMGIFNGNAMVIPAAFIPIVWIASLVDSMTLTDKVNAIALSNDEEKKALLLKQLEEQNRKIIAMVLSIIPGAGHMFLGLQRQGIQLMSIFFFSFFITDWINISIFMALIPIIWFFGLFDAMNKAAGNENQDDGDVLFVSWFRTEKPFIKNVNKFLAYGLIAIGCFLLFERIVLPELEKVISLRIREYTNIVLLSIAFIAGGVKLLMGSKSNEVFEEGDENG
ncbi:hypothetical protein [Acetivibrio cellulolyticus]|uniref:hypothetical protein n=1 Tax=Acetivibrio cellulolyticus TaxID=35830 RepID=UPI0001E2E6A1|nr:hypothetical protein [Acetivibrio cellulolyticus]